MRFYNAKNKLKRVIKTAVNYEKLKGRIKVDVGTHFRLSVSQSDFCASSGYLIIRGWALSNEGVDKISLYSVEEHIVDAEINLPRLDVHRNLPQYKNKNAGWKIALKISNKESLKNLKLVVLKKDKVLGSKEIDAKVIEQDISGFSPSRSETSKCRKELAKYCVGNGIDIGFGGDPIVPYAICMDQPSAYAKYNNKFKQQLHGDCRDLRWFKDDVLDFVYSSHVLEDFPNPQDLLDEWIRVIAPGGNLVLFLPDEQIYREDCKKRGVPPNPYHSNPNFDFNYVKSLLDKHEDMEIIFSNPLVHSYSFELVAKKTKKEYR